MCCVLFLVCISVGVVSHRFARCIEFFALFALLQKRKTQVATTFAISWVTTACSFCMSSFPGGFFMVDFEFPVAFWITLTLLLVMVLPCIRLHRQYCKDWVTRVGDSWGLPFARQLL